MDLSFTFSLRGFPMLCVHRDFLAGLARARFGLMCVSEANTHNPNGVSGPAAVCCLKNGGLK